MKTVLIIATLTFSFGALAQTIAGDQVFKLQKVLESERIIEMALGTEISSIEYIKSVKYEIRNGRDFGINSRRYILGYTHFDYELDKELKCEVLLKLVAAGRVQTDEPSCK